ncbi:MAG: phage holin family protein [Segetibacter sp.]|nr:phage holin family protein [Segetibacter sp.]
MNWILQLLLNAGVLLLAAKIMPSVKIRSFGTAILVALVIGILNATIGLLLRLPLNLLTLGLLSFFVRLIVLAIVIKIADKFFSGFEVRSFTTAIILACIMAITGSLLTYFLAPPSQTNYSSPTRTNTNY